MASSEGVPRSFAANRYGALCRAKECKTCSGTCLWSLWSQYLFDEVVRDVHVSAVNIAHHFVKQV